MSIEYNPYSLFQEMLENQRKGTIDTSVQTKYSYRVVIDSQPINCFFVKLGEVL